MAFSIYNLLSICAYCFTCISIFSMPLFLFLQGQSKNIVTSTSRLKLFKEKLTLWKFQISNGNADFFPSDNESQLEKKKLQTKLDELQKSHETTFFLFQLTNMIMNNRKRKTH